jgi:DNA repair protein RadC
MPPFFPNPSDWLSLLPDGYVIPSDRECRLYEPLRRLVGSRSASKILVTVGAEGVARLTAAEIASVAGVRLALAARIVAARDTAENLGRAPTTAGTPTAAAACLPPGLASSEVELVLAIALDARHGVKALLLIAKGSMSSAAFRPRDLFRPLVRVGAAGVVMVHCHPSGDPNPSEEDIALTNQIALIGDNLGVPLVDHLIVSSGGQITSLFDLGLMPTDEDLKAIMSGVAGVA